MAKLSVVADLPQHVESLATQLQLIACAIRSMEFGSANTSNTGLAHSITGPFGQSMHGTIALSY